MRFEFRNLRDQSNFAIGATLQESDSPRARHLRV